MRASFLRDLYPAPTAAESEPDALRQGKIVVTDRLRRYKNSTPEDVL